MSDLAERVERLERQNRTLRRAGILMLLVGIALAAVGWTSPDGTVEARTLILKDAAGKLSATLGPGILLWGANGVSATLGDANGSGFLRLSDATGKVSASLGTDANGSAYLSLSDATGKVRASLGTDANGSPSLSLFDATGQKRASLGVSNLETTKTGAKTETSESSLVLFDRNGKVLWSAGD